MLNAFSKTNWVAFEEYRRIEEVYVARFVNPRTRR